jgi:hypothetical protein
VNAVALSFLPQRVVRRRHKGWTMPAGAIYVGRPTRWGNPFVVHACKRGCGPSCPPLAVPDPATAVREFRRAVDGVSTAGATVPDLDTIRRELGGRDLACWCPLDAPCHADVLLALANPALTLPDLTS